MRQYFININSEQKGPFSLEELKDMQLTKNTPIWYKELEDWTTVDKIDEVKELLGSTPPPFTTIPVTPPPFAKHNNIPEDNLKKNENSNKKRNLLILISILVIGVIIALVVINLDGSKGNESSDSSDKEADDNVPATEGESSIPAEGQNNGSVEVQKSNQYENNSSNYKEPKSEYELRQELLDTEKNNPTKYLSASYSYHVNIAANTILEGSIYNNATMAEFKNVKVWVGFYSKTGVLLGQEEFTVMEFISPGNSLNFRHKITGWWENVAESKYQIVSAQSSN